MKLTRPVVLQALLFVLCVSAYSLVLRAQSAGGQASQSPPPQWQIDAGNKKAFDVASVKRDTAAPSPSTVNSNVALGPGDYYSPTGGLFSATNFPLFTYITFAYKATGNQVQALRAQAPKWVLSDRFDIQARVEGTPSKDQMRLMMQSLLVDRFKLLVHRETQQLPVLGLVPEKAGKMGPQLQVHPNDPPCSTNPLLPSVSSSASAPPPTTVAGGFPITCGGIQPMTASASGHVRIGARNVTMGLIATTLSAMPDGPGRPVLDQTGLGGTFDFTLEWTPQLNGPQPPGSTFQPEESGTTFLEALKEQLGLKLEPQTGPVDVLVIDHIGQPSEN